MYEHECARGAWFGFPVVPSIPILIVRLDAGDRLEGRPSAGRVSDEAGGYSCGLV